MKDFLVPLTLAVALASLPESVQALLLPVAENTSSTAAGKINQTTGNAVTLPVTPKQKAFLIFDLSSLPPSLTASNITSARLNLYVSSLVTAGDLTVHVVTNEWRENTPSVAAPGYSSEVVGTIPAASLAAKSFVEVDVTAAVSNWCNGSNNFGLAIATISGNVRLASKEGLGTGFPALLEIESADATLLNVSQLTNGTLPLASLPGTVVTNNETGVTLSGAFGGNGSGLTNLNPTNLSAGTAAINISGNATLASNVVSGIKITNAFITNTVIANSVFAGNGSGLTNLNPTYLAVGTAAINISGNAATASSATSATTAGSATTATTASNFSGSLSGDVTGWQGATVVATSGGNAIVTNNETGVTLSGVFSGNGAGLTNIPSSAVSGLNATATAPPGMALIPAGAFTMGDNLDGEGDAIPTVSVTVSGFCMDVNLVSLSQWQSVYYWATANGYSFDDAGNGNAPNQPVYNVNWYDVVKWCNARSEQAGGTPVYYTTDAQTNVYRTGDIDLDNGCVNWAAAGYRLPTEAEWEKAARGGLSGQRFPWGNTINENLANYYGCITGCFFSYDLGPIGYNAFNPSGGTTPVGYFALNGYGLYDMAGNLLEWCWDWYGTPYAGGTNPQGSASVSARVVRGGNWIYDAYFCRAAFRYDVTPAGGSNLIGFRSVLASSGQ